MRRLMFFSVALGIIDAGCSSTPSYRYSFETQQVTIITEPTGAEVWQTMPLGDPPLRLGVTPLNELNVIVIKDVMTSDMPPYQAHDLLRYVGNIGVRIEKQGFKPYVGLLAVKKGERNEHRISLEPLAAR